MEMTGNDPNLVLVKPMRAFRGVEGFKSPSDDAFPVSRVRAAELKANGLVRDADAVPAQKNAPEPENKRAPEPQNKGRGGR
jgi:hypothetical protein